MILQTIQEEIEEAEKGPWEYLEYCKPMDGFVVLYECIQGLRMTRAWLDLYEKTLTMFRLMKVLLHHVLMSVGVKEKGDEELAKLWKDGIM